MATTYYDWTEWATSTSTSCPFSAASTCTNSWTTTSAATASYTAFARAFVSPKSYFVEPPEHWTNEDVIAFAALVNHETKTGFVVVALLSGDTLIMDPEAEKRSMADFKPLLVQRASYEDLKKIKAFFEAHPLVPPIDGGELEEVEG